MKKGLLGFLLFLPFLMSAQRWSVGASIGFNSTDATITNNDWQNGRFFTKNYTGFSIGPVVRFHISEPLSLEAGIMPSMTGVTSGINLNYKGNSQLENQILFTGSSLIANVPFKIMYSFQIGKDTTQRFTLLGGINLGFTGSGSVQTFTKSVADEQDSVTMSAAYQNVSGMHVGILAGFQFEGALHNGNMISYGLEFRYGNNPLVKETVNYNVGKSVYHANLETSGPFILLRAVYYWGLVRHPHDDSTK